MNFLGRIICVVYLVAPIQAWSGWGSLSESRDKYPALFVPNAVVKLTIDGVDGYAYAGSVRQSFAGNTVQSDTALYRRATLVAKRNLLRYLQNKDESLVVEMSGGVIVYEYTDGAMRTVICFVPKNQVSVHAKPVVAEPLEPKADALPTVGVEKTTVVEDPKPAEKKDPGSAKEETKSASEEPKPLPEAVPVDQYLKKVVTKQSPELWSQIAQIYINDGAMDKASFAYSNLVEVVLNDAKKDDAAEWVLEAARFEDDCKNVDEALRYYRAVVSIADSNSAEAAQAASFANSRISKLLLK